MPSWWLLMQAVAGADTNISPINAIPAEPELPAAYSVPFVPFLARPVFPALGDASLQ
jgi:hypothetical protein